MKRIILATGIFMASVFMVRAQEAHISAKQKAAELLKFSRNKGLAWVSEKRIADSLAAVLDIPVSYKERSDRIVRLQRLGDNNRPVYYATDNINAAQIISADKVWTDYDGNQFLNGDGTGINVWDGGGVLSLHQEFSDGTYSRIVMRELNIPLSNHSTHISGTMAAAGVDENARGIAGRAIVYGWDFDNDMAEMASAASEGILVSNHSYGPLCGWYYNTLQEIWYWYGDPEIADQEDYKFGHYSQSSADIDYIAWCAPYYLIVKSAGNDRNDAPAEQPVEHYIWEDSWVPSMALRETDGGTNGYDCLSPMSVPKNILTVGAVDDNKVITSFSSFGPTDDGRIKPDVAANGLDVYSPIAGSETDYGYYDGTSMAAASASGSIALIQQLQNEMQPGVNFLSSSLKGVLIHTADESGTSPGPDYKYGWGLLNVKNAVDLIIANTNSGGRNIIESGISQDGEIIIPVDVPDDTPLLKITLCWTDPPGQPSSETLNDNASKLVNDLDIVVEDTNTDLKYYPWVLDHENPELPAHKGGNHIDNVEQVCIDRPEAGHYDIRISCTGTLSGGVQKFSLILSGITAPSDIYPPKDLHLEVNPANIALTWSAPEHSSPDAYMIYRDGQFLAACIDTFYNDLSVITDSTYRYYVTASYKSNDNEFESLATNTVAATIHKFLPLPFIEDFENDTINIYMKNNSAGWCRGDSDSLSSYYLNFGDNETVFIGADSYTYGRILHVNDIAATPPLNLAHYSDVILSFEYMLVTGIYDAIDELHVVYRSPGDQDWIELMNLQGALKWTQCSMEIPDEACINGVQIGFYYDDLYRWGMGAGIDNIHISGTPLRTIDLMIESQVSPVSACNYSEDQKISIIIRNVGDQAALPGDQLCISMNISTGYSCEEQFILDDTLRVNESLIYNMSGTVNMESVDTYLFEFLLTSDFDTSLQNNAYSSGVNIFGLPVVQFLDQDITFCEYDQPSVIGVSPAGGILTGIGVSGSLFDPALAGPGTCLLSYEYTDANGCYNRAEQQFSVFPAPALNIGDDQTIAVDDTFKLKLPENEYSYLWFDYSSDDSLQIIGSESGPGQYVIWVEATSVENCSSSDTIILTISPATKLETNRIENIKVYPNPCKTWFSLVINNADKNTDYALYGPEGQLIDNWMQSDKTYFDVAHLPDGYYILRIRRGNSVMSLPIIKIH